MKSPIITVTLIALCSWLGWSAYEETNRPVPATKNYVRIADTETTGDEGKPGPQRTANNFPPLDTLSDIVSRPLFNVSRRPITVEVTTPDVKPTDLNLMLSGIVIGRKQQIAHLRSTTDKQTLALSVGDKIGDWQIQSIFPDRVVLQSGGRTETLFMQKPGVRNPAARTTKPIDVKTSPRRASSRSKRKQRRQLRRGRRTGEKQ